MKFEAFPNSSPRVEAPENHISDIASTLKVLKGRSEKLDAGDNDEVISDFPELGMTPEQERAFRDAVESVRHK